MKEVLDYINYRLEQIKMVQRSAIDDDHSERCSFAIHELEEVKKLIRSKINNEEIQSS
jgi:hypothetical protein